jgi:SAM-dependent methyltransferase
MTNDSPTRCPICGDSRFVDYNTRAHARCFGCGSLERTRLLWLILERLNVLSAGLRVLHVAPEACLMDALDRVAGTYVPCDFQPQNYAAGVRFLNLCTDLPQFPDGAFDLIIHNHVLEHVQCSVVPVMRELARILRPGGSQLFSVPFRGEHGDEDLDPNLAPEERRRRFGQEDHMRIFGRRDFVTLLTDEYGADNLRWDWSALLGRDDARRAMVPEYVVDRLSGHSIFRYQRPSA